MSYLGELYGKRSDDFVKGVIAGYLEFAATATDEKVIAEIVNDLSEFPENFNVKGIASQGFV